MILAGASREIEKGNYTRLRVLILICFFVIAGWGLVDTFLLLTVKDNAWIRTFVCASLLLSWWACGRWKNLAQHFDEVAMVNAGIPAIYIAWLGFMNSWEPIILLSLIVHSITALGVIRARKFSFAYAAGIFALSLSCFFVNDPKILPLVSTLGVFASLTIALFSNISRDELFATLKASEETSYKILSNIPEGVVLFDVEGKISLFNSHAPKILDLSYEFLAGRSYSQSALKMFGDTGEPIYPDEQPHALARYNGNVMNEIPIAIVKRDGTQAWVSVTAIPLTLENPTAPFPVLMSCRDITEARETQKRLVEQQAILASASKLTALGEMSAGIAHEINNPLAIISGRASQLAVLCESNGLTPEKVAESARKIEDTVKRISRIIVSMRSVARESNDDPFERTFVSTVIEDALALCKESLAKYQIQLLVDYDDKCELECRPGSISQILMNLISNAKDAVADMPGAKEKWIRVSTRVDSQQVMIFVEDSGPGIAPGIRAKIMQPFFTTKEVGKGTGLGLSISQGIAVAHGGKLYLDESTKQTRFILNLPLKRIEKSAA